MSENVYYSILDHCYLANYMNLESKNIDTVISNLGTLLTEIKAWRNANLEFIARQGKNGTSQGFVFYTLDQRTADKVFRNGYLTTTTDDLFATTSGDEDRNIESKNERAEFNETLNVIFQAIVGSDIREETLIAKSEEGLSDSLFSDLKDMDPPTVETQAALENETEPLPEELFDDLEEKYE